MPVIASAKQIGIFKSLATLILAIATPAMAAKTSDDEKASICRQVSASAAHEMGVPPSVMLAITLTETGRNRSGEIEPWPWTVNMEGAGHWFPSRAAAEAFVDREHSRGARSYDVGCFQVNYKWHGGAFRSRSDMFDPLTNARYAATFLRQLFDEFGDWGRAAGAYHSRTPRYANRYRARFEKYRSAWLHIDQNPAPRSALASNPERTEPSGKVRVNTFPFLKPQASIALNGSLVPLASAHSLQRPQLDLGTSRRLWDD